jgi:DNA-binding NtrC family response regulator
MTRILIADDEPNLRSTLGRTLRAEGYDTADARDGVEAVSALRRGGIDVVILDLSMPRLDGFGVLEELADEHSAPPVIVLTAHASLENAVRAVRMGAFDFLEKPPAGEAVLLRVRRALERARVEAEAEPEEAPEGRLGLIGDSPAMGGLLATIERVAPTAARVLISGENGVGKELVARAIHELSPRREGPLVRVNCAAIPSELFEAELFGHVKGAFTGAVAQRRGRFERASGGTLFLDEVGEIPSNVQPKLLRALEEGEIERVGAESGTSVDVRVIAATNRDLPALVAEGGFREDLYYRLEVVTIRVPSLREHREDVPALARHFLARACAESGRRSMELSEGAQQLLAAQDWPGNVRQLRNLMERVAILAPGPTVEAEDVAKHVGAAPAAGQQAPPAGPLADAVSAFERRFIAACLDRHQGNVAAAARELEVDRSSLYKKLRALGIER